MKQIKLFGAFRSGSNFARAALELNYEVEVVFNVGGFKHVHIPAIAQPLPIIATVKEPFAWLQSLWRYVNTSAGGANIAHGSPWFEFLTQPIVVNGVSSYRFTSPIDYWNSINYNYLSFPGVIVVRYEDMIAGVEKECSKIAERFNLTRRQSLFINITGRCKNMSDDDRRLEIGTYTERAPFSKLPAIEFSEKAKNRVLNRLDHDLMLRLGY